MPFAPAVTTVSSSAKAMSVHREVGASGVAGIGGNPIRPLAFRGTVNAFACVVLNGPGILRCTA